MSGLGKVSTGAKLKGDPGWKVCAQANPERRTYPNGKKRPADVCDRMQGHPGPHQKHDGPTFLVLAEWPQK